METEKNPTQTGKTGQQPARVNLEKLRLIDALNCIDTELRRARQVLSEFYDDVCINEESYPTAEDAFNSAADHNKFFHTHLFKLINEYPRIVTLLEITSEHLAEGHKITIDALCEYGGRKENRPYVVG